MKYRKFKTDKKTKILLLSGAIGCWLFVLASIIEGGIQVDYNPIRHPVSSLSIGEFGWLQVVNFIILGLLILGFALGVWRSLQPSKDSLLAAIVIGLVAIGLIGAGIFTTDPEYGYPVDIPLMLAPFSIHGQLHEFFSILIFVGLPIACFILRHRFLTLGEPGWAAYSAFTGIAMFGTFILSGLAFKQKVQLSDFAGLYQRLSITLGSIWITLLALHLIRTRRKIRKH